MKLHWVEHSQTGRERDYYRMGYGYAVCAVALDACREAAKTLQRGRVRLVDSDGNWIVSYEAARDDKEAPHG